MSFTTNQWAILVLVLVLGWVLGLASRSGGARYRREANDERIRRETAEERVAALNARVTDLERERAAPPVVVATKKRTGAPTIETVETNPITDPPAYPHDA